MKETWFFINFFRLRSVSYFSCETQYIENTRWRGWGKWRSSEEQGRKPMLSKEKIIYSHNFTFCLAERGSEERRTTARGVEFFVTVNWLFQIKISLPFQYGETYSRLSWDYLLFCLALHFDLRNNSTATHIAFPQWTTSQHIRKQTAVTYV